MSQYKQQAAINENPVQVVCWWMCSRHLLQTSPSLSGKLILNLILTAIRSLTLALGRVNDHVIVAYCLIAICCLSLFSTTPLGFVF